MNRALLRNVCVYARTRLVSPPSYNPSPRSLIARLAASTPPKFSFYSTQPPSHGEKIFDDPDHVPSNEELKKQIEDFYGGNEEAFESIFEAIMKRQLTGKHGEADKQLMEEISAKNPIVRSDIDDEVESDSDSDESSGSEGETDVDSGDETDSLTKEKTLEATDNDTHDDRLRKSLYNSRYFL